MLKDGIPSILHLPSGDSAANRVISLFASTSAPDLPGALVLAFDSPLSQVREADPFDHEETPSDTSTANFA